MLDAVGTTEDLSETPASLPGLDEQSTARDEVRRVLAAESKPVTWAAKEAGISYQTFAAWLAGTYAGRNDSVLEKVRIWLDARRTKQSIRAVMPKAPAFVETQTAEAIITVLEHAQHAPDVVVITGLSGIGKTMACEAYKQRSPSVWMVTCEPCFTSPRAVLGRIVEEFFTTEKFSSSRVSGVIVKRVRGSGGLLIVDEAQNLSSQALDQLRTIHDLAGIGVAFVGNPTIYSRLEGDGRQSQFAQLYSRVGMRLDRKTVLKRDIDALLDAWGVTGAAERKLLHTITRKPGALRSMRQTLRLAFMRAASDGRSAVQVSDVTASWQQIANQSISDDAA
jgi:DNA transposition AAA+ family ATPase